MRHHIFPLVLLCLGTACNGHRPASAEDADADTDTDTDTDSDADTDSDTDSDTDTPFTPRVAFFGTQLGEAPALHLADRTGDTTILTPANVVSSMKVSPDGSLLAFVAKLTPSDIDYWLYTVPLSPNSTPTPIMEAARRSVLTFSDDGSKVVWTDQNAPVFGIADLPTGATYVRTCGSVVYSCREVALQPGSGDWWFVRIFQDYVVARWDGTEERPAPYGPAWFPPAWSPDGTRLWGTENGALVSMNPDGTDATSFPLPAIYDSPAGVGTIAPGAAGVQVVFTADVRNDIELWSLPQGASTPQLLSSPHPEFETDVEFDVSPSGTSLVYASGMARTPNSERDLYLTTPTVSGAELLPTAVGRNYSLTWSPDESGIVVTELLPYDWQQRSTVIDLDTRQVIAMSFNEVYPTTPQWAPNGSAVRIPGFMVNTATGATQQLPELTWDDYLPLPMRWFSDSSALVAQRSSDGALITAAPDGTIDVLVGPGFEPLLRSLWQVLDPEPAPPAPTIPSVADVSDTWPAIPDPIPATHRYLHPATGSTFTSISVGAGVCALQDDGTPVCGAGAAQPPTGELFSQVSVGDDHWQLGAHAACGIGLTDGVLRCWGNVPATVPDDQVVLDVGVGTGTVCALLPDGSLQCWGANALVEPGPFVALSHGGFLTVARRPDGSLWTDPYSIDSAALGTTFDAFSSGGALCVEEFGEVSCGTGGVTNYGPGENVAGRFSDVSFLRGAAPWTFDTSQVLYGRHVAQMPPTGRRFSDVESGDGWTCGLVEDGSLVFCHDHFAESTVEYE